jgi:hypothetical protein
MIFFRYHSDIPDDFMMTTMATLHQIALAVKEGGLTAPQLQFYERHQQQPDGTNATHNEANPEELTTVVMPMAHKQPCCPWFTCCM